MVKYELRVHVRDVIFGLDIGNHTGYDLITTHEDGSKTIQYIDLYTNASLDIEFYISAPVPVQEYTITDENGNSRTILWGTQTAHDGAMQATTIEYLTEYKVYTSTIINETNSAEALKAFNKIKLEATILDQLKDELLYNPKSRNCNTSTNYFAQQYLNGQDVFAGLPYGIYMGYSDPFYDPNSTSTTDVTIKQVRDSLDKFYNITEDKFNLSETTANVVQQDGGWYIKISDGTQNFVIDYGANSSITTDNNDSYIISGKGNDNISAGSGNDIVDAGSTELETGDVKTADLGAGNDLYVGGQANDNVQSASGNNTVILGAGSDTYTGGSEVDIVDGGSGNLIKIRQDLNNLGFIGSGDITLPMQKDGTYDTNTIHLGAGNDVYS